MSEHPDRFEAAAHLRDRVHEVGARFLMTELRAGLALLELAETSESPEANARRRALAVEAYEVVADRLARSGDSGVVLTDEQREMILSLHHELATRLGR